MKKVVLTTPFAESSPQRLGEASMAKALLGGECFIAKPLIMSELLAEKIFSYLPEIQRRGVVGNWTGVTIGASLVDIPEGKSREVDPRLLFISEDDRADYEARLIFPEYFL